MEFFTHQLLSGIAGILLYFGVYLMYLRYGVERSIVWVPLFVLSAFLGFKYPVFRLYMERLVCLDKREEEVLRLEFLIRLEKQLPGMTSLELLEHLAESDSQTTKIPPVCTREEPQNPLFFAALSPFQVSGFP